MAQGTIKRLVADRGFGFIAAADKGDVFFHLSSLDGIQFEDLKEGQKVEYDLEPGGGGGKGPRASAVRLA